MPTEQPTNATHTWHPWRIDGVVHDAVPGTEIEGGA
jgi:hypothetical protein